MEVKIDLPIKKNKKYGDREEVFNGFASMTKGKLTKDDLILDEKTNKYKSKKAIERGRALRLVKPTEN